MTKLRLFFLLILILGCSAHGSFAETLRLALAAEPKSVDVAKIDDVPSATVARQLLEGLTSMNEKGEVIPSGAEKWQINDAGTVYTFSLRKDAKWSDGLPVTAHDYVFAWQRSVNPTTGNTYASFFSSIVNADEIIAGKIKNLGELGVRAVDDYTFEVSLKAPTPYFLGLMTNASLFPISKASYEKHGDAFVKPGNFVSNGAYALAAWEPQEHIHLKKNPHYHAPVKIDEVYFYTIEKNETQLKRYKAGEIDLTSYDLGAEELKLINKDKNLKNQIHIGPFLGVYYYSFNTTKAPFDDIRVREALSLAMDREKMVKHITQGNEMPLYGFVAHGVAGGYTPAELAFKSMDQKARLARAKTLLKEAGFDAKKPLKIDLLYNTNDVHKKIAIASASMFKALGAKTEMTNVEFKILLQKRFQKDFVGLARAGWVADYNDAHAFLTIFSSENELNDTGFKSPEFDDLLKASESTTDQAKRMELLRKAEQVLLDNHVIIPVYNNVIKRLVKPYVKGYTTNAIDMFFVKNMEIDGTLKK